MKTKMQKRRFTRADAIALIGGCILFVFLFSTAARSIGLPDESQYYTVPLRFLRGDRIFTEEWNFTQLASLFDVIPFRLFTLIAGGTDGIILCMRYFYLAVDLCFYAYMYLRLRGFGTVGVVMALSFCAVIPQTIPALSYHSVAAFAVMHFCLLLLITDTDRPSRGRLVFAGLVLSCGVLAEPFLLFAFFLYFILTLVFDRREKKEGPSDPIRFFLCKRTFGWVLVGTLIAFFIFALYFLFSGSMSLLPDILPHLHTDRDFNTGNLIDLSKLTTAVRLFGAIPLTALTLTLIAAAVFRARGATKPLRQILFIGTVLCAAVCYFRAGINVIMDPENWLIPFIQFHSLPALFWASSFSLLCETFNPRITAGIAIGWIYSLCVDIASANVFGSGGKIASVFGIPAFLSVYGVLRSAPDKKQRKKTGYRATAVFAWIGAAAACCWTVCYPCVQAFYPPQEKVLTYTEETALSEKITEGPCRGLYTCAQIHSLYDATIRDMNALKQQTDDRRLTVLGMLPYAYLCYDGEIAANSAWFSPRDMDRLLSYWKLFPDKRPASVYIPYYDAFNYRIADRQSLKDQFLSYVDGVVSEGEAGYLILIRSMDLN